MQREVQNPSGPYMPSAVQVYSSPLPPPEALAKYEQVQQGLVEKIIQMTESQANHRRELESRHLDAQIKHQDRRNLEANLGQVFAFLIALIAIVGGVYTALKGYEAAGSIIGAAGLGTIVAAFIAGRQEKNK